MISKLISFLFVGFHTAVFQIGVVVILLVNCTEREKVSSPADFDINISDQSSIGFLNDLIKRRPDNTDNYLRLAAIYYEAGNLKMAQKVLNDAAERIEEDGKIELELSKYYLEADDLVKAEESFSRANSLEGTVEYNIVQASILVKKGFYDRATQIINLSLSKDPGNADLYHLRAIVQKNAADTLAAVDSFEKAISSENVKFSTVLEYLSLLTDLNNVDQFYEAYDQLPAHHKQKPKAKFALADIYSKERKLDSAKMVLATVDESSFSGEKYHRLSRIHFDSRDYDSARYFAERSYKETKNLESLLIVARAHDMSNDFQLAETIYTEIIETDSTLAIAQEELEKLRRKIRYLRDLRIREQRKTEFVPIKPITPINQN